MQMITTTRWNDEVTSDWEALEKQLLSPHLDDPISEPSGYNNWVIEKKFDKNRQITLNGKPIEYNVYTYSVNQGYADGSTNEDMVVRKDGFIIPYTSNGALRYIINRNTGALTILRKMLSKYKKSEIKRIDFPLSGDLFVWLIYKVYTGNNTIESESDFLADLKIDYVRAFKGNTEDMLTKVSAVGESVMNIISTLSFLLESHLNQITLDLSYREHSNIEVTLGIKNTVAILPDSYLGVECGDRYDLIARILLTLYIEILPIMIQRYQSEIESGLWGQGKCVEFLRQVANDLSEKVAKRVSDLEKSPELLEDT